MLEKARELGLALANSAEFQRMKAAQSIVENDEALSALIEELKQKRTRIVAVLGENDSDGTEALALTNDIERLQGQLEENEQFIELLESERQFGALITAVDEEINACIGGTTSNCNGNCASCGGCRH